MAIAQKIAELAALTKADPEDLLAVVEDPTGGAVTKNAGFGTFLSTYNISAAEISAGLSNDDLDFKNDFGNVLRYGTNTIPDTTDMTVAFQNAVDSNAYVSIPAGIYLISSTVTSTWRTSEGVVNVGQTISGAGEWVSVIHYSGTGTCLLYQPAGRAFGCRFEDFYIRNTGSGATGFRVERWQRSSMENVSAENFSGAQIEIFSDTSGSYFWSIKGGMVTLPGTGSPVGLSLTGTDFGAYQIENVGFLGTTNNVGLGIEANNFTSPQTFGAQTGHYLGCVFQTLEYVAELTKANHRFIGCRFENINRSGASDSGNMFKLRTDLNNHAGEGLRVIGASLGDPIAGCYAVDENEVRMKPVSTRTPPFGESLSTTMNMTRTDTDGFGEGLFQEGVSPFKQIFLPFLISGIDFDTNDPISFPIGDQGWAIRVWAKCNITVTGGGTARLQIQARQFGSDSTPRKFGVTDDTVPADVFEWEYVLPTAGKRTVEWSTPWIALEDTDIIADSVRGFVAMVDQPAAGTTIVVDGICTLSYEITRTGIGLLQD